MSPRRPRPRQYHGKNFLRRRKVQDRVRENSVVKTFGPLNRSLSIDLPKIVVHPGDTDAPGEELYALRQTKSSQDLSDDKSSTTEDTASGSEEQQEGNAATSSGWNNDTIRHRLLKSVARRDGDKVTLLVPLMPVYGSQGRNASDAVRSWIRTNTIDSRWNNPVMAHRYLASPFRSVGTQTDPIITITASSSSSTPCRRVSGGDGGDGDDALPSHHHDSLSRTSRWDRLVDMESTGTRSYDTHSLPEDIMIFLRFRLRDTLLFSFFSMYSSLFLLLIQRQQ
ncbi:hypothetical protein E2C01_042822 [Portunus trituberculatus]|uniref:Uncharacterized protein n=1 Tax=Portunus trituberculatus TaxID=210409 RepID=A0A5B7FXJ9_PORTR|nr:hypothetical protein [Portunus trituberculatus]